MNFLVPPLDSKPDETCSADTVLASKGKSFYLARHFLGSVHAAQATRLYRLCRYIDDLADEASSIEAGKLALSMVATTFSERNTNNLVLQDGLNLLHECRIDTDILMDLIAGVRSDLEPVRIPDVDALLRYCYQVAGTVGLMMCKVLAADSRLAFKHAVDLGIAMQITNICRDVADDARADRRYLPATMVGDVSPTELLAPSSDLKEKVQHCLKELLELARKYYQSGELGLSFLPLRARCSILVASRVYGSIGVKLKERDFDCWSGRVVVESKRKAWITSRALLGIPVSPSFWMRSTFHNESLHAALSSAPQAMSPSYSQHAR